MNLLEHSLVPPLSLPAGKVNLGQQDFRSKLWPILIYEPGN